MTTLSSLAQTPAPSVAAGISVKDAVEAFRRSQGGAVLVMEKDRMVGILSERDLLFRVVGEGRDPKKTRVSEVMSTTVETLGPDATVEEAFDAMTARHIRHLAVVDGENRPLGLVSLRAVAQARLASAAEQLSTLEMFVVTDVPGG